MAESCVVLYGDFPSFDHRAGPVTAVISIKGRGKLGHVDVDPEGDRCRLEAVPSADKWMSARGLLSAARVGLWGLEAVEDRLPRPILPDPDALAIEHPLRSQRRPYLPRDLASCPTCGGVVVLLRDKEGPGYQLATPSVPLAARLRWILARVGIEALPRAAWVGHGRPPGRPHALDCRPLFRLLDPTASAPAVAKRKRGRPRLDQASKLVAWKRGPFR